MRNKQTSAAAACCLLGGLIIALAGVGCESVDEEFVEDQCARLQNHPETADPELERRCLATADYLPDAQDSFADRTEVPQVYRDGDQVVVNLVLSDATGAPLAGVTPDDVQVTVTGADGSTRDVTVGGLSTLADTVDEVTIPRAAFSAVMDYSGSIPSGHISDVTNGLRALFSVLGPPFEAELIHFSDDVVVTQAYTSDGAALVAGAENPDIDRGLTSLFDGLATGIADTSARTARFRFILLFTDGGDNDSEATEQVVLTAAKDAGLPMFVVGVGFSNLSLPKRLADETGGFYTYIPNFDELEGSFADINALISGTYQLDLDGVEADDTSLSLTIQTSEGKRTLDVSLK